MQSLLVTIVVGRGVRPYQKCSEQYPNVHDVTACYVRNPNLK